MNFLFSILPTVVVIGILIIVHEFGHFLACRLSGVRVEKFSIGFGPEIFHWQGKETRYAVSLLPLGGFVKPAGESFSEVDASGPKPGDYLASPLIARIFIVAAGVLMNYLLAYFLFVGIFMAGRPLTGTTIGGFVEDFPAATSGLHEGDKILSVNGQPAANWVELTMAFEKAPEGELRVRRGGEELPFRIAPKVIETSDIFGKPLKLKRIGIKADPRDFTIERFGFLRALREAWDTIWFLAGMTYKALFYLIRGKLSMKAISGPIGIIAMTGDAMHLGLVHILNLTANLSVSLAVINLLPVPALDGGHLLFLLIEGVIRRPLGRKAEERLTQAGFFALMALMVFVIYNDLVNLAVFDKIRMLFTRGR